ncbi:MAG: hypothetical protein HYW48_10380 [Deltaproteobacteria bacterium]|nr:hypothetical protein [Deltaproteobacteria bacterium]
MRLAKLVTTLLFFTMISCDPEGRKKCDWVLEPEPDQKERVQWGYIPVCARNRATMKQDCRLQASLQFAKDAHNKKFRYTDMKVASPALPRTITDIKFCDK